MTREASASFGKVCTSRIRATKELSSGVSFYYSRTRVTHLSSLCRIRPRQLSCQPLFHLHVHPPKLHQHANSLRDALIPYCAALQKSVPQGLIEVAKRHRIAVRVRRQLYAGEYAYGIMCAMRSCPATSTCFPSKMYAESFRSESSPPRTNHENLYPRGFPAHPYI